MTHKPTEHKKQLHLNEKRNGKKAISKEQHIIHRASYQWRDATTLLPRNEPSSSAKETQSSDTTITQKSIMPTNKSLKAARKLFKKSRDKGRNSKKTINAQLRRCNMTLEEKRERRMLLRLQTGKIHFTNTPKVIQ